MKINPNPIRDKAYFAFSLSAKSFVTLSIYDMHGRLIATPVNEMRNEGFNEVIWKTENTPAGVYICRIKAGSSQKAKTIIVRSK